jgi:ubiquinone/menaquinone biosynthesis C-methylase UbiE
MISILLAVLAIFSRKKHVRSKLIYSPAYSYEHVEEYDAITYDGSRIKAEMAYLYPLLTEHSHVLDVGSGTGHHVHALQQSGIQATGLDLSYHMVAKAKQRYPHTYMQGDALNMSIFQAESFSHITCLYFTVYYMKHKERFFRNANHWLTPSGYLILHLSKQWAYGPTSRVSGALHYSSKHSSRFHRECITKEGKKCFEHNIYMEPEEKIVDMALRSGFTLRSIYTYELPYTQQRMYILQKS